MGALPLGRLYTEKREAIHATVARNTTIPKPSSTRCSSGCPSFVLTPAKNNAAAKDDAQDEVRRPLNVRLPSGRETLGFRLELFRLLASSQHVIVRSS